MRKYFLFQKNKNLTHFRAIFTESPTFPGHVEYNSQVSISMGVRREGQVGPPPWPTKIVCFSTFFRKNNLYFGAFYACTMYWPTLVNFLRTPMSIAFMSLVGISGIQLIITVILNLLWCVATLYFLWAKKHQFTCWKSNTWLGFTTKQGAACELFTLTVN